MQTTIELRDGEDTFAVNGADSRIEVRRGTAPHPTPTVATDAITLRGLVFGRVSLADARSAGLVAVSGDQSAVEGFLTLFGGAADQSWRMSDAAAPVCG